MSDKEKEQLNNDDLQEIKSLIGPADPGAFTVDEILREFGTPLRPRRGERDGLDLPWPQAPHPAKPAREGKVVAFPGRFQGTSEDEGDGEEEELEEEPEDSEPEEPENGEPEQTPGVIQFPEEEGALKAFFRGLSKKVDDSAQRMFAQDEATDWKEVRRLERYIPGTDQEEAPDEEDEEEPPRPPRRQEPPPPDLSPQELAKRYGRGLKGLRVRAVLTLGLAAAALVQLLVPALGLTWPAPLDQILIQRQIALGLMAAGTLLGADVLWTGLARAARLRLGMDTLTALACVFTLADGAMLAVQPGHPDRLPYTAVVLAGIFFLLHGTWHKKCALRLSCRTAAASATPYRVTLEEGLWDGRGTYVKRSGGWDGYGSQIQMDDGVQRIFRRVCPLLLLGDLILAALAAPAPLEPGHLVWSLSALFATTAGYGGAVAYGRAFHKAALRLSQSGAALAGWPGIAASRQGARMLVTDGDLFPPGYVELNGYKVIPDYPAERIVAYTATLLRDTGSGLAKLFHDQLRSMGGLLRHAEDLCCHEGGGLSASIRGDAVLVGSAAFMNLMEVSLPQGLNVKNAVFCAVNGELAGIFALSYTLPDTVVPALEELIEAHVGPVLATRDFNLIPSMLHQRFKLDTDRMDFPPVERRRELSDPDRPCEGTLTALLCREGIYPLAEALTGAKRLRWAARLGAALCCGGALLGMLLCAYLTSISAYTSLSPLNLLVYMMTWLAPVWFLSDWVHRF